MNGILTCLSDALAPFICTVFVCYIYTKVTTKSYCMTISSDIAIILSGTVDVAGGAAAAVVVVHLLFAT